MTLDRIAVVSDVHGNLTAYRAVLAEIDRRGIPIVLNLGDVAGKGPRGAEAVALTRERCAVTVRGNWDAFLGEDGHQLSAGMRWWRDELSTADRAWLADLPGTHDLLLSGRRVRLFHASSTDEFTRVHFHHSAEQFAQMFAATPFTGDGPAPTVVGYGDIHDTYVEVDAGRTLFNAGSVGNPLDEPTAAFAVLEGELGSDAPGPFSLSFVRVPYDVEAEIAVARDLGMPEADSYAIELRTAVYRGRHAELGLRLEG
ncbi:metallophosphoesterase family protein [Brachybacterium hainanense]|uniref:Metallophosphoesterase family protein n=1 Tax=Brachybacterium hainanense TaxID=1541174 RepID=A0ABV6R669_9MICO